MLLTTLLPAILAAAAAGAKSEQQREVGLFGTSPVRGSP